MIPAVHHPSSLSNKSLWWHRLASRPGYLMLIAGLILLLLINPNWKIDPDSVGYLSMARSLARGNGLMRLGFRQLYYAPFYSVLIAPSFWFGKRPFLAISIINVLTAWMLAWGTYCWFKRYSRRGAGLIAALVAVNTGMWDVCREPRADTFFSTLLVWAAVFLANSADARKTSSFVLNMLAGSVLLVAACMTREVGIFLGAGFVVAVALRAGLVRSQIPRLLAAMIPGVSATIAVVSLVAYDRHAGNLDHAGNAVTYTDQIRDPATPFTKQVIEGFRRQTGDVGRLLIPCMWGSWDRTHWLSFTSILYIAFTAFVLQGWWKLARRTTDPLLWMLPFYGVMFLVWPFDQGTRFNVPMLPLLWASVWMMLQRWPQRRVAILMIVLGGHIVSSLVYLAIDAPKIGKRDLDIPPLTQLAAYITDPGTIALMGLPEYDKSIMTYLLDRQVLYLPKADPVVLRRTTWLLTVKGTKVPPSFVPTAIEANIQLCHSRR